MHALLGLHIHEIDSARHPLLNRAGILARSCVSASLPEVLLPLLPRNHWCFRARTSVSTSIGQLSLRGTTCCGRGRGARMVSPQSALAPLILSTAAQAALQGHVVSKHLLQWMRQMSEQQLRCARARARLRTVHHLPGSFNSPWYPPLNVGVLRPQCLPASVVCQSYGATATR